MGLKDSLLELDLLKGLCRGRLLLEVPKCGSLLLCLSHRLLH
jgi:hypothetical protein